MDSGFGPARAAAACGQRALERRRSICTVVMPTDANDPHHPPLGAGGRLAVPGLGL